MLCPNCGTENTDQAEFCTHCAATLEVENVAAAGVNVEARQETAAMQDSAAALKDASVSRYREEDVSRQDEKVGQPEPRITHVDIQSDRLASEKPVVSLGLNIGIIIGSLFFPIIGIIMGFTYLRKEHPDARKAGKTWLAIGVALLLIQIVVINLR